jgi:hypothetical protein
MIIMIAKIYTKLVLHQIIFSCKNNCFVLFFFDKKRKNKIENKVIIYMKRIKKFEITLYVRIVRTFFQYERIRNSECLHANT